MEAIILAGGLGTRLKGIISDLPKPMAPINGIPFLEILLNSLAGKGFRRIILSTGYKAEIIKQYFGFDFRGLKIDYVTESSPLGTGGAVNLAIKKSKEDHIYIFNGDTYLDLEIEALEDMWLKNRNPIVVGREVADAGRYGCIDYIGDSILGFKEKGKTGPGMINAGCYVFLKSAFDEFAVTEKYSLEDSFLPKLIEEKTVNLFISKGKFIDIGIPEDYYRAAEYILTQKK